MFDDFPPVITCLAQAAADRASKQRNHRAVCKHTRGWRIMLGEVVLPKVYDDARTCFVEAARCDSRLSIVTPTGWRISIVALAQLLHNKQQAVA